MGIIDLSSEREKKKDDELHYYFSAAAICVAPTGEFSLPCFHRWIAGISEENSLFKLQCPECGAQDSFASIIPSEYLECFK